MRISQGRIVPPRRPGGSRLPARLASLAFAWALLSNIATAHPHVFIEVQPTLVFAKGRIVGVQVDWRFDELFSAAVVRDFDADRDHRFSAAELERLKVGAFDNLQSFGYFTHFLWDGRMEVPNTVQDFTAFVEQDRLVYRFVVRPPRFVDPRRVSYGLLFFDETYYVDLRLVEGKPVAITGAVGCSTEVDKNPDLPDYGGMFLPELVHVRCS